MLFLASGVLSLLNGVFMEQQPIAVCFALQEEAGPFKKQCGDAVPVFYTGIGRLNAEKALREYLQNHAPALLLTCGFAGGLASGLKVGDVVFEVNGNDAVRAKLTAAGAKEAKIVCVDRIASTAREKQQLRETTGADAAEMESGAVQAVCRERGIPCATVRVISDTVDEDLPLDFNQFLTPEKTLDMSKLMMAVAKAPWKMGALMELQRKTKVAAQQLGDVLAKVIAP
jgi:adenosylhomocysteine nucleosidase